FDAAVLSPAPGIFSQHRIPLFPVAAADEERRLPFQAALSTGNLSAGDRVGSNLGECLGKFGDLRGKTRGGSRLEDGGLLLEVVASGLGGDRGARGLDLKDFHSPLLGVVQAA